MRIKLDRQMQAPAKAHSPDYDSQWAVLRGALIALDALAVLVSLTLAYTLRISSGLLAYSAPYSGAIYRALALVSVPTWLGLFALSGLYRRDTLLGGVEEYKRVVKACTAGVIALVVLSFIWRDPIQVSRGWLLLAWGLSCGMVGLERFLVRRVAYQLRRRGWLTARVLVVGVNDQGIAIARQWAHSPTSGMQVVGFVDDFKPLGTPVVDGLKVIGRPTALAELAHQTGAHEVIVVPNAVAWETFEEIIVRAGAPNGYKLRLSPGFYGMMATGVAVTNKTFVPLFTIDQARIVGVDAVFKAMLDYGLGIPLLALAAPLAGLIALGLKLVKARKPALARYQTIGQGGTTFTMYKFNARSGSSRMASWFERMLYQSGLDKLPQLVNVAAGQMSLVGPRPRVIGEEADARTVRNLQTVKPGIIGPWTMIGRWTPTEEIQDELYYVRNWTIWLDLQILVTTALSWLSGQWSARLIESGKALGGRSARVSAPGRNQAHPAISTVLSRLKNESAGKSYRHYDSTGDRGTRF